MKAYVTTCLILFFSFITFSVPAAEEPLLIIDPQGHSSTIAELMFTPDGQTLISVSHDKTIRLWDVESGELRKTIRGQIGEGYEGMLMSGALSPDGKTLAVGGYLGPAGGNPEYTGHIRLFEISTGEQIGLLTGHENVVFGLDFSPDGQWLASGSGDRATVIWDIAPILAQPGAEPVVIAVFGGNINPGPPVFDVAFSPKNTRLLASADFWRTITLRELKTNPTGVSGFDVLQSSYEMEGHRDQVYCVEFSPNGDYIASGSKDGLLVLWDASGKRLKQIAQFQRTVATLAFSADNSKLVASGYGGQETKVYAIPSGELLTSFTEHDNTVEASAFYGNDLVATAGGNEYDIYLWDANSGVVRTHITTRGRQTLAVAFDRQNRLAFGTSDLSPPDLDGTAPQLHPEYAPLERVFDFAELSYQRDIHNPEGFSRVRVEFEDTHLELSAPDTLQIGAGGTIRNQRYLDGPIRSYTFTPEGNVVVGSSYSLKLYQPDGRLLREFHGHHGEVWAISVSEDGRFLASGSDDQTIKLWNLASGECLATLFVAADHEWVCWTPQGYYAASAGGEKYIGWHVNHGRKRAAEYYPISVFRKQFFLPQLVKNTLATGNFAEAFDALHTEQQLAERSVTDVLPPRVRWIAPESGRLETERATIHIRAQIESERPLNDVKVLVNGRPAEPSQGTARGLALGGESPKRLEPLVDEEIALLPGRNEIRIFAANEESGVSSPARMVIYRSTEELPNLYLVSIGISDYLQKTLQLRFADDDARAVSQLLHSQEGRLYRNIYQKPLYNSEATRPAILDAIEWLHERATHKDVVILFIAAHGTNEDGQYVLLPSDVNPDDITASGIGWQHFSDLLGALPAKVLLILDTCHSGQLGLNIAATTRQLDNTEALRSLSSDEFGVVILAASTGSESSLETEEWGHGAFTKAFLEALQEGLADYSGDGIVHLRELDLYLAERVEELTQGVQHPTTQKPSTISRFPMAELE